jgi:3',5'-cyclic-nucleotide phosphodiesterase
MVTKKILSIVLTSILFIYIPLAYAEEIFKVVVLGCGGGPRENNLSGYLIAPKSGNHFICLDAGSLLNGITIANQKNSFQDIHLNSFSPLSFEGEFLQNHITHYLISHAHLDHIAGLVLNSTNDTKKSILGIHSTIDFIRDSVFNWDLWPNFGSEGRKPRLNQYHYERLNLEEIIPLSQTTFTLEPFLLSHPDGYASTAFLLETGGFYALYFGDTAPDALESEKRIEKIWKRVTPLIEQDQLRCIFLECSYYENNRKELFGHLNPHYMMEELSALAHLVNPTHPQLALRNVKIIVTHIKDSLLKGVSSQELVKEELEKLNTLGIEFLFPEQGDRLEF